MTLNSDFDDMDLRYKMKIKYDSHYNSMLPQDSDVSNETFEKSQDNDENSCSPAVSTIKENSYKKELKDINDYTES